MALHVRVNVPPIREAIEAVAEGLVRLNVVLMEYGDRRGVELPELYRSGVVYRREGPGKEFWQSGLDVLGVASRRSGDCEDLAAYRVAELRYFEGEEDAYLEIERTRRGTYHAVVRRGAAGGHRREDPSRICVELERARKRRAGARGRAA